MTISSTRREKPSEAIWMFSTFISLNVPILMKVLWRVCDAAEHSGTSEWTLVESFISYLKNQRIFCYKDLCGQYPVIVFPQHLLISFVRTWTLHLQYVSGQHSPSLCRALTPPPLKKTVKSCKWSCDCPSSSWENTHSTSDVVFLSSPTWPI